MSHGTTHHILTPLLDRVYARLKDGEIPRGMQDLITLLRSHRLSCSTEDWKRSVEVARQHQVMALVQGDPFTSRCYQKPNGYPGDATLLDLIYSTEAPAWAPRGLSVFNQALFRWTSHHAAPQAVRNRRQYIAALVDEVAYKIPGARILTIAAGHLREAELSQALRKGQIGTWIATDQDAQSLEMIDKTYGSWGVATETLPIMSLLRQRATEWFEPFDLVYAAGLYDYLNLKTGRRLLEVMFSMVRPGGTVLITNFAESIPDVGYMEAYMDWYLIYRSVQDMMELTTGLPSKQVADIDLFADDTETLLSLQVTKR